MRTKYVLAAIGLAAFFAIGTAQAGPINGAVTVSDTFDPKFLPCAGGGIVSHCLALDPLGAGNTGGGTGDFSLTSGAGNAIVAAWIFANPGGIPDEIKIPGFTFDITAAGPFLPSGVACGTNGCADGLIVLISGTVTGAGFDPTLFTGSLTLTGACAGTPVLGNCNPKATYTGGYSYSLAASGVVVHTPEPASLLLLGVALAGMGFARRRKLN